MNHLLRKKCVQKFWCETCNEETTLGEIRDGVGALMLGETDSENVEWVNLAHDGLYLLFFFNTGVEYSFIKHT